ncbi:DNA-binding protein HU-beta [Ensifer mexicanus]|nr:DNA-binding protein HU-beta [Sinorhizobium mexicanum]
MPVSKLWKMNMIVWIAHPPSRDNGWIRWKCFRGHNEGSIMTTTTEIADKIATDYGLTKAQSKTIVEAVFAAVAAAATSGAETSIPQFGKFKVKETPERDARNPATGATIKVAAAKKLTFQPAKALKDAMNK